MNNWTYKEKYWLQFLLIVTLLFGSGGVLAQEICQSIPTALETMVKADQELREEVGLNQILSDSLQSKMQDLNKQNAETLKKIVKQCGWPTRKNYNGIVATQAWLIVQHADHDLEFQKEVIEILKVQVKKGDGGARELAYLTDRVNVSEGKLQTYGTQFMVLESGKVVLPEKDQLNKKYLNKKRKEIGLESIESILKRENRTINGAVVQKPNTTI